MVNPGSFNPKGEDWIAREFADMRNELRELKAANIFGLTGILPKNGGIDVAGFINSLRANGTVGVTMDATGVFVVMDATGTTPVARFGPLDNSAPGQYGVEVLVGTTWVQLGAQSTTWATVSGKPSTYPPTAHQHAGTDVTSAVANATNAVEATHAAQADGSQYGWTNNVAGTEFYQLWVGNNPGYKFGRNVSSVRYKMNIRAHNVDPAKVLQLTPVLYDRKPVPPATAPTNEFGLIAEEVARFCPELVTWFNGEIDSVRYDLVPVALLSVVKHQDAQIKALGSALQTIIPGFTLPTPANMKPNVPSSMAPTVQPAPLPYTIQP